MKSSRDIFKKQIIGFGITGTLSTLLMFVLYVVLHQTMSYQSAYLIAYCVSVLVLYFMNVIFVFDNPITLKSFLKFPLIYLLQYLVGAVFLEFIVRLGFSVTFAPVVVVILLLPVTFVLNRLVFNQQPLMK